ncbi:DUF881 domain-containing protein [Nocardioides sp. cx-173]|uniref:DUF881 domain-containing protein n=1 Tax=Nocardioides sp. cx-173 TaxID=2898796 RepID=UPI001E4421A0|nr:DUF881 domain-containing protein [Nocardioides sp. cx-173]MCD4526823.1 DUF881 domain-containing protein [Nocardioides sp. cx-173]UGB43925.1 DUF881 domain-containing protein [Nocardioides sp. cx-173]
MSERPEPPPELPPRVTLPLLDLIQRQALDEDYLLAAERRAARAEEGRTEGGRTAEGGGGSPAATGAARAPGPRRVAAVAVAVFGIMAATAAVQTQRNAGVRDEGRASLVARIEDQNERVSRMQVRIADLREENADTEDALRRLGEREQALTPRLRRLGVRTGFTPTQGEGIRVTVKDAETGDLDGTVRDEDLALLADGLWAAGAEAIAINGQRLTALSAIRTSGVPIEVNGVGIASPYTVLAIGDRGSLQATLLDTSSGIAFDSLSRRFGFTYDLQNEEDMSLPSGPRSFLLLRSAAEDTGQDRPQPKESPS